jgi:hypothetical protein
MSPVVGSSMGGRHGHRRPFLLAFVVACLSSLSASNYCSAFTLVMMGRRRGKVGDKKLTSQKQSSPIKSLNGGKGQEITGVSLPAEGTNEIKIKSNQMKPRILTCIKFIAYDGPTRPSLF